MGWEDQGLAFDVSLHVGTLLAVLVYFYQDLKILLKSCLISGSPLKVIHDQRIPRFKLRHLPAESRLVWGIALGTLPAGLVGLMITGFDWEDNLRSPMVIATTTTVFGLLLGWADLVGKRQRDESSLSWRDILLIGIAQAVALIPGTSRSGITITMGLLLGLQRKAAARFSFLLSIPAILLAGGGDLLIWLSQPTQAMDWSAMLLGLGCSAVSAYLCIYVFMKLLEQIGLWPFVIYRLGLAAVLWIWVV